LIEKKTVKFGDASEVYPWADFVQLETLRDIQIKVNNSVTSDQYNALLTDVALLKMKCAPIINGGIIMPWRKPANEIPAGWKECIDFRGKTIVGLDPNDADFNVLGAANGSKNTTIERDNLPNMNTNVPIVHPYEGSEMGGGFNGGNNHWRTKNIVINPGGSASSMNIMNPYRIVYFIEPKFD
jgi:hypothetical protein